MESRVVIITHSFLDIVTFVNDFGYYRPVSALPFVAESFLIRVGGRVGWAFLRSASLRAERQALWRDSDTVPAAGIDDYSFYNDTRRTLAQKISGRDGLYGEEP